MWTDQLVCVSHFFQNFDVSFMVLCGFLEISKPVIGDAKTIIRSSFSCPVSHFFGNCEVSFMVLCGYLEISKSTIGDAKTNMRSSFLYPPRLPLLSKF